MSVLKKIFHRKQIKEYHEDSLDRLLLEINEAKEALNFAQQNLNNAEGPFVDVAAVELELAKTRLNALLKQYKHESLKKRF